MPLVLSAEGAPVDAETLAGALLEVIGALREGPTSPGPESLTSWLESSSRRTADAARALAGLVVDAEGTPVGAIARRIFDALDRADDVLLVGYDLATRGTGPQEVGARLLSRVSPLSVLFLRDAAQGATELRRQFTGMFPALQGASVLDRWMYRARPAGRLDESLVSDIGWWISDDRRAIAFDALLTRSLVAALPTTVTAELVDLVASSLLRRARIWWRERGKRATKQIASQVVEAIATQQVGVPLAERAASEASAVGAVLTGFQQFAAIGQPGDAVVQTNTLTAALVVGADGRWSTRVITHTPSEVGLVADDPEGLVASLKDRLDAVVLPPRPPDSLLLRAQGAGEESDGDGDDEEP